MHLRHLTVRHATTQVEAVTLAIAATRLMAAETANLMYLTAAVGYSWTKALTLVKTANMVVGSALVPH